VTPLDRLAEICVFEHEEGRFAAGFESDVLHRSAGLLHDFLTCCRAAGESDLVDVGMLRDGGSCDFALAVDDVDHSWRETGLFNQVCKIQNRERRLLCRLENDCVATSKRWAESVIAGCQSDSLGPQNISLSLVLHPYFQAAILNG